LTVMWFLASFLSGLLNHLFSGRPSPQRWSTGAKAMEQRGAYCNNLPLTLAVSKFVLLKS